MCEEEFDPPNLNTDSCLLTSLLESEQLTSGDPAGLRGPQTSSDLV